MESSANEQEDIESHDGSFLKIYQEYIKNASEKENEDDKDYE